MGISPTSDMAFSLAYLIISKITYITLIIANITVLPACQVQRKLPGCNVHLRCYFYSDQ